jgi:plasmid stability protein
VTTLTIKNVDDETASRLAQKADLEGLSTQEYVRRLLSKDAATTSPTELVRRQLAARADALSGAEYDELMGRLSASRKRSLQDLGMLVARHAG